MKGFLGGLIVSAVAAAIAACGAPGDDAASTTNADTTTPAIDPDYEVFASRADAEAFINKHVNDIFGDLPLPATDPRSVRAQAALDKHWPAVVAKLHPSYPEPIVFVVDDDATVNAMAVFDPSTDKALNIIYVYSGLMRFSDADVESTLLHESGHLTMKNGIQRYSQALTKYYQAGPTEGVGLAIPNDPKVQARVAPYAMQINVVGGTDVSEIDGVPSEDGFIGYLFDQYSSTHDDASSPDCATMQAQLKSVHAILAAAKTPFDGSFKLTSDQSTALAEAATAVETTALTCLKPPPNVDIDAFANQVTGEPLGMLAQILGADVAAEWAGKDALTGLFAIARDVHAKQRGFESASDYKTLRIYTGEEQADDFALTVMASEGTDLGLMRTMFLDYTADATYRAQCAEMLANGVVPPYNFVEPHHGNCYRAYHVGQFAQYLANGGVGVVIPSIPLPAVTAMAAIRKSPFAAKPWKNSTTLQ